MGGNPYPGPFQQPYGERGPGGGPPRPPPVMRNNSNNNEGNSLKIEIEPGVYRELRGAEETWNAVATGQVAECSCVVCNLPLLCIQDAEFVLCPGCKVMSPLFHSYAGGRGGVGLGLRATEQVGGHLHHHQNHNEGMMGGGVGRVGRSSGIRQQPPQDNYRHPHDNYHDYNGYGHGGGGGGRYY